MVDRQRHVLLFSFDGARNALFPRPFETHSSSQSFHLRKHNITLTQYRPAMPFGNRKVYFRGSFHNSIVTL